MKKFFSFVRKEFIHIRRDRRTLMILLLMPVIMILLFGYAITTEVRDTRLGVVDLAGNETSARVISRLSSNSYFSLDALPKSVAEAEQLFNEGKIDVALVLPADFPSEAAHEGKAQVQLLIDGMEPNQASVREGYVVNVLTMQMQQEMSALSPNVGGTNAMKIDVVTRMLYNPQGKSEYNFVPGVMALILMLICVMMTGISIVREKECGTMEVLLASPLSPLVIVCAKLVPYFVISCANVATILLLSVFVIGVPMAGSLFVFLSVTLLFILVALLLGLFISTVAQSQLAAMLVSLLLIVPTVYLSGLAFPIESMPAPLQWLSAVIPARWFLEAARKLMIQGVEAVYVWRETAVLLVMAVLLLFVARKKFKIRL
ncbi:MAG: ABC transporter permease [Alloprevotella sp.]